MAGADRAADSPDRAAAATATARAMAAMAASACPGTATTGRMPSWPVKTRQAVGYWPARAAAGLSPARVLRAE